MAERIDSMPEKNRSGASRLYPWEDWLDGSVWKLTAGEDFKCSPAGLRSLAAKRTESLTFLIRDDGQTVYLQARKAGS